MKFISYSLITKNVVNNNTNDNTNDNTNKYQENVNKENVNKDKNNILQEPALEIEEEPIRNVDKAILYCYPNIYTKKNTTYYKI